MAGSADNYAAIPGPSPHFATANDRLAQLVKDQPDSGPVQEAYAASLLESGDAKLLQAALAQWQRIARRSEPSKPRWLRAQYSAALTHFKLGDKTSAAAVLRSAPNKPPGSLTTEWREQYQALLKQCGG